ncbi:MAG TPA: hypothetical protein VFS40_16425, partial [Gemmatimonadales bacterium]|nr:hypothetical protein [Gemmatimonadales bacterium]
LYLAGAAHGDTLARAAFRRDLTWIADSAKLEAFDRAPADSVGAWVRRFWAERDAEAVRPEGERLREHLRRWWYVQDHFALVGRRKKARFGWGVSGAFGPITAESEGMGVWALFAPGALPANDPRALGVDDRGAVYMRHGEPLARASSHAAKPFGAKECYVANESWKYELPTGSLLLHFCASEALGAVAPTTLVSMLPLDADILGARMDLDTRFATLELELRQNELSANLRKRGLGPNRAPRVNLLTVQQLATYAQASVKHALTTDSYALTYAHDLAPTVQIYALGDGPRQGRALVVFAVRGDRLAPTTREGRLVYPLKLRVTAVDTAQGVTRSADTLRLFATRDTLAKGQYLYGTMELPLPAGSYYVRGLVEETTRHAAGAAGRAEVEVPGAPGRLTASDVVTGSASRGLAWTHGGRRIALNPLDTYRVGEALELYYELAGTRAGGRYRTTVELARLGGGGGKGKDRVSLGFTDVAEGGALAVQRTLALDGLVPGRYLLTLTVQEDGSDRSLTRERIVTVVAR